MLQNIELIELNQDNLKHLETMYCVRTHPEVDSYLRSAPPTNFSAHIHYLNQAAPQKRFYLIQADSILCGYCQLTILEQEIEIGMAMHPDFSNLGIGTQALSLFLARIEKNSETKNKPIILFVKKDNPRAMAVYAKYGFERLGDENVFGEYLMKKD